MVRARHDIVQVRETTRHCSFVASGLVARYGLTRDGSRQITAFYIPGDTPSLETIHIDRRDNNLGAVVDSTVGLIAHEELKRLMTERPTVLGLIWRESLIQAAVFREWLMRNSQLPAHSAMAHLFCEIYVRCRECGRVAGNACDFPVTQEMLAAALGLTSVHVNRTLQLLRESGMVDHKGGRLIVYDFDPLAAAAEFDPYYLHLQR
jgi:CRP-like cAMP-binding protein